MAARLLLVHSPLVGCGTWDLVAAELVKVGCEVNVPDLTGTVTAGPPFSVRQAQVIADSAAGPPAILIGHSGAGPLLAAAGAMTREGVRGYIFVDAGLPAPGQAWMQTVPAELAAQVREMADAQGWLPPWPQWWGMRPWPSCSRIRRPGRLSLTAAPACRWRCSKRSTRPRRAGPMPRLLTCC
jgi:pimeloyl-ACP methyl ester carboxylesterase